MRTTETWATPEPASEVRADRGEQLARTSGAEPRLWIRPHYASFNGLRALAICLVFLIHYGAFVVPAAAVSDMWAGVDLFFVLSGFLITGILFDTRSDPHFFRNFYTRRALRIFPLFYGFFLLLFLLTPVLHIEYKRSIVWYVLYLGNLVMPFFDLSRNNPTVILVPLGGTRHLNLNIGSFWTLCVEEQFYMLWPALVLWGWSRKRLMRICVAGWLAALLCRISIFLYAPRLLEFMTWYTYTRADTLFLGAWLALWLRGQPLSRTRLRSLAAALFVSGLAGYFVCRILPDTRMSALYGHCFSLTWVGFWAAGLLLFSLDDENGFSRVLRWKAIAGLGAVSYGFYLVHALYLEEMLDLYQRHWLVRQHAWLIPVAAFAIALGFAKLSFRYFEMPFLRLKRRLAPQGR